MADSKEVLTNVRPVSSEDGSNVPEERDDGQWSPGFWAQFPKIGMAALLVALIASIGEVIVLITSNGKSQSRWPHKIAPNVILSAVNSVANICFSIAIDLHRSWAFSTSLKQVALAGKFFNVIALAALTSKLLIIDSVLMQKATSTYHQNDPAINITLNGFANTTFPRTGGGSGTLATYINHDLQMWYQSGGSWSNYGFFSGCENKKGNTTDYTCFFGVAGAGFEFDCSDPVTNQVDYGKSLDYGSSAQLFHLGFEEVYGDAQTYSYISMDIVYSQAEQNHVSCPGQLLQQTCKLRPAVVNYPVSITGADNQLKLGIDEQAWANNGSVSFTPYSATLKQQMGYKILSYQDIHESDETNLVENASLGGLVQAFNQYLSGDANMTCTLDKYNATTYPIQQSGMAPLYLTSALASTLDCGYSYLNPLAPDTMWPITDVVNQINQMMFLIATDASTSDFDDQDSSTDTFPDWQGTAYVDNIHYATNYAYMWGGFISTLVCIACIVPVYWGFWQLGRPVTLGPFEIAAAFRSPMVNGGGTVDEVIRKRGDQRVQFGHIVSGDAAGQLAFAEPQYVARVDTETGFVRHD